MGIIARRGINKSMRTEWFHFVDGCEFLLRYVNPDEREKLLEAAQEKLYDVKQGKQVEKLNTAKLAAEMRRAGVIKDWKIDAAVLPQIIDLVEYPEPGTSVPFDEEDCEHLVRYAEGLGVWLLENFRALGAFAQAAEARRKNGSSPTPVVSSTPSGEAEHEN